MNELPTEMVLAVLQWLDVRGLCSTQLVCRSWRSLSNNPTVLWRCAYLRTWPPPLAGAQELLVPNKAQGEINWKRLCRQRVALERYSIPLIRQFRFGEDDGSRGVSCRVLGRVAIFLVLLEGDTDLRLFKLARSMRSCAKDVKRETRGKKRMRGEAAPVSKPHQSSKKQKMQEKEATPNDSDEPGLDAQADEQENCDDEASIFVAPPVGMVDCRKWRPPPPIETVQHLAARAHKLASSLLHLSFMRHRVDMLLSSIR